ncbi:MAG: PQQ-dependent sugar dehydrogenase [Oceanihabitans sp.]
MTYKSLLLIGLITISLVACAQDKNPTNTKHNYKVIVPNLDNPWGFVFLPDGSMLINEKSGKLIHFKNGKSNNISGLPEIKRIGQGGLMDIELHPNYKENAWIYFSYASSNDSNKGANTSIMRAKIDGDKLINKEILYQALPNTTAGQHFGSRIVFDNSGYLFFSIGERGERDINPQDITRDGGKIYRLHADGSIPTDNPFVNTKHAKKAIYSYGHRNPQGMAIHPQTGAIWSHEHGPKGGDEINIIQAGKNYGWPKITYGINYYGTKITNNTSLPGMEQPLHYWDPSIAPSGMAFITSDIYPNWKGNLLVGSLKFQYLNRCVIEKNKIIKEERLVDGLGRVRSVRQGPDGYIYAGIENVGIVKIIPKK